MLILLSSKQGGEREGKEKIPSQRIPTTTTPLRLYANKAAFMERKTLLRSAVMYEPPLWMRDGFTSMNPRSCEASGRTVWIMPSCLIETVRGVVVVVASSFFFPWRVAISFLLGGWRGGF